MLLYGALVGGSYWPTTLVCLAIISPTERVVGQCSPWCSVDCHIRQGWTGIGASATARTSC